MQRRPGPTITDRSLGGSETPSMVGPAPRVSQPVLAQGKPSAVRSAGAPVLAILGGGLALLLVLGGIAALVAYLIDPSNLDALVGGAKSRPKPGASARAPIASARPPAPSATIPVKPKPSR